MDDAKIAEARQMLSQIAVELTCAAEAARLAAADSRGHSWTHVQQLYTRFDQAAQLLRDMRRTVDAALAAP
jgi:hypothetical protein